MKTSNKVLMFILVTFGMFALVSCGGGKGDYDKAVAELNKTKADLAQANAKIADMEKALNAAQAQPKGQPEKPAPAVAEKPGTAASQKEMTDCQAKVDTLTKENNSLKAMLDKLKAELAELQKKVGGATQKLPSGLPK
jgi:predicted RNase H-like nuclease (RuvC/YqgF family)